VLTDPDIRFSTTPANVLRYARFMHSIGSLREEPASWRDLFFEEVHELPGS
jgi:NitT/TauT family transport system substrate-binding protein